MSEGKYDEEKKGGEPAFDWLPEGTSPLADGEYDAIVLGTGLKECILSGLLAVNGRKVLQLDRNNYYGGDAASLNLTNLYEKFRNDKPMEGLGSNRDYNIDLIPKFIMACGKLVKMLLHTKVTRYLEFKNVDGSYFYKSGKIHKVPVTADEAIRTSLMGMFEKRRFRNMVVFIHNYDENNPKTHQGLDLHRIPMRAVYEHFGVDTNTQMLSGHALALKTDDTYIGRPAIDTVRAIQLYAHSLERYGKSPYLYPLYGLGGLPESFSRLCAVHGGTFMLNRGVDDLLCDETGKVWGIKSGDEVARAKMIIGDPTYFPENKLKKTGQVIRSIFILNHPVAGTNNSESCQIIIPAANANRKSDIYVCVVSHAHNVAANGAYIAILSTTVETSNPVAELQVAVDLLGPYIDRFDSVSDYYEPINNPAEDQCYITSSYDATSHFETTSEDVLRLYQQITGEELDLSINADTTEPDDY